MTAVEVIGLSDDRYVNGVRDWAQATVAQLAGAGVEPELGERP